MQAIPRGYAADVPNAAAVVGTPLRLDRSNVTNHAPLSGAYGQGHCAGRRGQILASPARMRVEDGIMTLGEQPITARAKDKNRT